MDFTNRVAMITGAGSARGIGRETAIYLASLGATIILTDINAEGVEQNANEIISNNGKAYGMKLDVTDRADVQRVVKEVMDRFGKIDILVNSAGISLPTPVTEITDQEWDKIFNVNVKGIFILTQEVLGPMIKQQYGRIVNLSSVAGKRGAGLFGSSHYAASKAAVSGFSKAVAREMAANGITCNTVVPGVVDTDVVGNLLTDELEQRRTKDIPIGRKATAFEIAYTIAFLASEHAGYITGEEVDINGGLHID